MKYKELQRNYRATIAVKPTVNITPKELEKDAKGLRLIEFTAVGKSGAGIEFYSWDFAYDAGKGFKPDVIIDKDGRQVISLPSGAHSIAVKVVDNDGLETIEAIKLTINGTITQE